MVCLFILNFPAVILKIFSSIVPGTYRGEGAGAGAGGYSGAGAYSGAGGYNAAGAGGYNAAGAGGKILSFGYIENIKNKL